MKKTALVLCSAVALAATAHADISYNNFSAGFLWTDSDGIGIGDGKGGQIALEVSPVEHLYLTGSLAFQRVDTFGDDTDGISASLGVGGFFNVTDSVSLACDLGVAWSDVDLPDGFGGDETAFYVRPHVRAKLTETLELHLGAGYDNLYGETNWVGFGKVYLAVFGNLDLTVGAELGDDTTSVLGGVRVRF